MDLQNRYDESCLANSQTTDTGIIEEPDEQAWSQPPTTQPYATPPTQRRLVLGHVAYVSGASQSPNRSLVREMYTAWTQEDELVKEETLPRQYLFEDG